MTTLTGECEEKTVTVIWFINENLIECKRACRANKLYTQLTHKSMISLVCFMFELFQNIWYLAASLICSMKVDIQVKIGGRCRISNALSKYLSKVLVIWIGNFQPEAVRTLYVGKSGGCEGDTHSTQDKIDGSNAAHRTLVPDVTRTALFEDRWHSRWRIDACLYKSIIWDDE